MASASDPSPGSGHEREIIWYENPIIVINPHPAGGASSSHGPGPPEGLIVVRFGREKEFDTNHFFTETMLEILDRHPHDVLESRVRAVMEQRIHEYLQHGVGTSVKHVVINHGWKSHKASRHVYAQAEILFTKYRDGEETEGPGIIVRVAFKETNQSKVDEYQGWSSDSENDTPLRKGGKAVSKGVGKSAAAMSNLAGSIRSIRSKGSQGSGEEAPHPLATTGMQVRRVGQAAIFDEQGNPIPQAPGAHNT